MGKAASALRTAVRFACVSGLRGMKSVQQSGASCDEMGNVPNCCDCAMISSLSEPMSGRNTGSETASFVARMLSSVCEATCPRLSPVTMAFACS